MKELDLTEGRATGIPTIQNELQKNGSPAAAIETDEFRTYFLIDIFCREDFIEGKTTSDVVKDGGLELTERQRRIVDLVRQFGGKDGGLKVDDIVSKTKIGKRTIERELAFLREHGIVRRLKGRQKGYYEVVDFNLE